MATNSLREVRTKMRAALSHHLSDPWHWWPALYAFLMGAIVSTVFISKGIDTSRTGGQSGGTIALLCTGAAFLILPPTITVAIQRFAGSIKGPKTETTPRGTMQNYTKTEQAEHRSALVMALRESGYERPVIDGKLNHDGMTIGGVLVDVMPKNRNQERPPDHMSKEFPEGALDYFGLTTPTGMYQDSDGVEHHLSRQDTEGMSFEEQARIIESEPDGLINHENNFPTWQWDRNEAGNLCRNTEHQRDGVNFQETWEIQKAQDGSCTLVYTRKEVRQHRDLDSALQQAKSSARWTDNEPSFGRTLHTQGDEDIGIT